MSASAVEWWFSLPEEIRVDLLDQADRGDDGAREAIVDVMDGLDQVAVESFMDWCSEVRERS